jgi:hypothetical protein
MQNETPLKLGQTHLKYEKIAVAREGGVQRWENDLQGASESILKDCKTREQGMQSSTFF